MSFFDEPEPPPRPPPEPPQPEWIGPPDNILGAPVPVELLVARSPDAVVVARSVVAYPNGVSFVLDVRRRTGKMWDDPLGMHAGFRGAPEAQDTALRFGVGFSDGSKATVDRLPRWAGADQARGPVLIGRGGGGGGTRWEMGYWLWPLPPDGPLAFVAEWPAEGILETRVEIDAGLLREAAGRAEKLWDENPGPSGGAHTSAEIGFSTMPFSTGRAEPPESE